LVAIFVDIAFLFLAIVCQTLVISERIAFRWIIINARFIKDVIVVVDVLFLVF
jgi:hypothetical protein